MIYNKYTLREFISSWLVGGQEDGQIHTIWALSLPPGQRELKSLLPVKIHCMGVGCE